MALFPVRLRIPALATLLGLLPAGTTRGASADPDPATLRQILAAKCATCHSPTSANRKARKKLDDALDLPRLVREQVTPGSLEKSNLWDLISGSPPEMPPEGAKSGPLDRRELDLIRRWILAGAPVSPGPAVADAPAARPFVSDQQIARAAADDCASLDESKQATARYFTLVNLHNAPPGDVTEADLQVAREALVKLLNSLSWKRRIAKPIAVAPEATARTLYRIDLKDLGWDSATWEAIVEQYPYAILRDDSPDRRLAALTGTGVPVLRADWFVFAASRPPLYHRILGLAEDERELERMLRIDVARDVAAGDAVRAAIVKSGVSRNNRLLERHDTQLGAYWKSYDFRGSSDRQDLRSNPLGPTAFFGRTTERDRSRQPPAFEHAGGEIIFNLPNGLQAYLLVNAQGRRLDEAPIDIVQDTSRSNAAITNGISCISCHDQGIKAARDVVRPDAEADPARFDPDDLKSVLALYRPRREFDALLAEDKARFNEAVEACARCVAPEGASAGGPQREPVQALAERFERPVDSVALAAAEVSLPADQLERRLRDVPALRNLRARLQQEGGVPRDQFVFDFAEIVSHLEGAQVSRFVLPAPGAVPGNGTTGTAPPRRAARPPAPDGRRYETETDNLPPGSRR